MSSHREAPEISKDPVADNTDVYAFVSPDTPDTVTLIANFIPLQKPDGGPNFYEFGDDVLYEIHVSNQGDARSDIIYQFRFTTSDPQPQDVPLQHRADQQHHDSTWNRPQYYTRHPRSTGGKRTVLAQQPDVPAGQRRACAARRTTPGSPRRPSTTSGRPDGVRGPAGGGLPRRPRQHLRPGHAASVREPPPDPVCRRRGRQRHAGLQRAHDRAAGADQRRHPPRQPPDRRDGSRVGDRRVGDRASRRKAGCSTSRRRSTSATVRGPRCRGWATRCSTRSSCRWPTRTGGTTPRRTGTRRSRST